MTDPTRSYNTDYPSIPSVAGSAKKNTQPIIDALRPYVERSLTSAVPDERAATGPQGSGPQGSGSKEDSTARPLETRRGNRSRPKIIELASGTGDHLAAYAMEWTGVDWVGSERSSTSSCTSTSSPTTPLQGICKTLASNVLPPVQLDVLRDADWEEVRRRYCHVLAGGQLGVEDGSENIEEGKEEKEKVEEAEKEDTEEAEKEEREQEVKMGEDGGFDGMIINNLLHCAPFPTTPSSIFLHATTLLKPGGWISLYGAFRGDDGGFGSEGDRKFHERFISLDPAFGLRTIPSIQRIAEENGWRMVERKGMMSGNWMVFFERSL